MPIAGQFACGDLVAQFAQLAKIRTRILGIIGERRHGHQSV